MEVKSLAKGLVTIVNKEVKEMIRDPRLLLGMIIVPLIMFPIMGVSMGQTVESVEDATHDIQLGVLDLDGDFRAFQLMEHLRNRSVTVRELTPPFVQSIVEGEIDEPAMVLVIPGNFTQTINDNGMVIVNLTTRMDTFSLSESVPTDFIVRYIGEYRQTILNERIEDHFPGDDSWEVQYPVLVNSTTAIDGEIIDARPADITGQLMGQSLMMPMILMILILLAAQLAATSVAMEKEEKTLETLLTAPVPRSSILFGKIVGVVIVSAIAVVAYVFGFSIYMAGIMSMQPDGGAVTLVEMGLVPSIAGIALMLITLFLSLISALSLSVLLASFTEDVRSAQSLMGMLYVPIFVPALILMFADMGELPGGLRAILMAIPFSYPVVAAKAIYTNQFFYVFVGIIYQAVFTAVVIFIAARLFSSENIMTARFGLKRKAVARFPGIRSEEDHLNAIGNAEEKRNTR